MSTWKERGTITCQHGKRGARLHVNAVRDREKRLHVNMERGSGERLRVNAERDREDQLHVNMEGDREERLLTCNLERDRRRSFPGHGLKTMGGLFVFSSFGLLVF